MLIRAIFIYYQVDHPAIWVLPFTHFESIFGGLIVGLGLFDSFLKRIPSWFWLIVGVISLYLVTRLPNLEELSWSLMATYPLIGLGTTLILFAVMQGDLWPLSSLFKNRTLGYLGKISYGLYVYHLISIRWAFAVANSLVAPERQLVFPLTVLLFALAFTVIIAAISYQLLERPFLRLKEKFTFIRSRPI
jgi:peptidoglycan/LPS O-acetylase OafA/YrhL